MGECLESAGTSQMFVTGPSVIKEVTGEEVTMEHLGGPRVHSETSGVADLVAKNDEECIDRIRGLLVYLPPNNRTAPPATTPTDDPQRRVDEVDDIVPDNVRKPYDIRKVIRKLVDDESFEELKPKWARNIVIGFGRLNGRSVGFVANQPMFLAGSLDVDCSDKASRFIRLCDAYNIPIITLVDVPGYMPRTKQEQRGIIRHGAKMLYAYAESTVPKVTVYLRKGYAVPNRPCAPMRWAPIRSSSGQVSSWQSWAPPEPSESSTNAQSNRRKTPTRLDSRNSKNSTNASSAPSKQWRSGTQTPRSVQAKPVSA